MESKTQPISKRMVWEAYKQVRKNGGSAGVDNISIEKFEENLKGNLYKIWNRMCSGSYYPASIKCVNIPKKDGSHRTLGIPTVGDRIAQTVVKEYIEEQLDKEFSESSYGYRKNKSAHDAIQAASNNCYKYAWVIDLDIRKFFDNLDHTLMIELLKQYTEEKWILMYIERWLKAPIEEEGEKRARAQGTPQGGVISPLLANLYLHEAFDKWLKEIYKSNPFERYADDIIIHCKSYQEAEQLLGQIEERLKQFKLSLHPEKTRIVYCKDVNRGEDYPAITFTFLGYDYKPRKTMNKAGTILTFFTPGISQQAKKIISRTIREKKIYRWTAARIEEIAEKCNSKLRGWINYYGKFRKWEMKLIFYNLNMTLARWIKNKYKLIGKDKAIKKLKQIYQGNTLLFAHWQYGFKP